MSDTNTTFQNQRVESLLSFGALCINFEYGFQQLNQYLDEVEQRRAGIPYEALGMSERRRMAQPSVISFAASGQPTVISDPYILSREGEVTPGSIALIRLIGVMRAEGGACSVGVRETADMLRKAYSNTNISAIILEVNSGGGEVSAMQLMRSAVEERNKPVIGFSQMAASAAYGTIAKADEVIADGVLAEFGSIGALIQVNREFLQMHKDTFATFYGENAPKKNKEMRAALEGDFSMLQEAANTYTDQFQEMIASDRPLTGGDAYRKQTLSGDMFGADEAKRRGLIDGVGNLNYAIKRARAWAAKYPN